MSYESYGGCAFKPLNYVPPPNIQKPLYGYTLTTYPKTPGAQARKPSFKPRPGDGTFHWEDLRPKPTPIVKWQHPEPWPPKLVSNGEGDHEAHHDLASVTGDGWRIRHYGFYFYINRRKPTFCPECGFELAKSDILTSKLNHE